MDTIRDFYRPEDLTRLKKRYRRERVAVWTLAGVTLGLCVLFCCLTTTRNAPRMELATLITSCLGGWLVIYRRVFGMQDARHEEQHARYLLEAPRTSLTGRLSVTKERLRIKDSIRIRILELDDGQKQQRLKVNETQVRALLPYDGKTVTLSLAGGYVAGIGGEDARS